MKVSELRKGAFLSYDSKYFLFIESITNDHINILDITLENKAVRIEERQIHINSWYKGYGWINYKLAMPDKNITLKIFKLGVKVRKW